MKIYNTLSRKLEDFKTLEDKKVTIYVCGITPYDTTHLGHAFTYISFDVLIRFLKFSGYSVIYTQNVTDINDRDKDILQKAKEQNIPWQKLTEYWIQHFLKDCKTLNWTPPTYYLKASQHLPYMVKLIKKLINNRLTYEIRGSIYLDISKIKDFGKLSKLSIRQMLKTAAEFEEDLDNPDKINPLDITLWRAISKNQPAHIPSFDSIFGPGRPGWHIECSAMSIKTLGEQILIHGGGKDLIFPHHEAEIAQSEGATKKIHKIYNEALKLKEKIPFAKYWLHSGIVAYQGAKMSKSKGNLVMVSDLIKKYSANAIRYLLLSNHWQSNWEYFEKDLINAQKSVEFIESAIAKANKQISNKLSSNQFQKILDTNLDTPTSLQFLNNLAKNKNFEELKKYYEILGFTT